jgi:hypothetical protein
MIKLFLLGVQPSTWKIIDELHQDTKTMVKWKQQTSEIFSSHQGVKQGLSKMELVCQSTLYIPLL